MHSTIGVCLHQSATREHNREKKSPQTFAHQVNFSNERVCRPCLVIIHSCYFDYRISTPFPCSRSFVLCSRDLDVLVRKGSDILYFNYPQIEGVRKSDHIVVLQIFQPPPPPPQKMLIRHFRLPLCPAGSVLPTTSYSCPL